MYMKMLSLVFTFMISTHLAAISAPTGDLYELIDVTRLPYLKDSTSMMVSSYDRTGGNDDGFSGTYSFIRKEGDNSVIFDQEGPGCIQRIWSATYDTPPVSFYFDDDISPSFTVPSLKALFDGTFSPFLAPYSGISMGAGYTYLPIPFAKRCKIVVHGNINFYQITYQKFPENRGVESFSINPSAEYMQKHSHVGQVLRNIGDIPWPISDKAQKIHTKGRAKVGKPFALADLDGPAIVRSVKIKADCIDDRMFRRALIRIFADNIKKPLVWSPLGDFFLDGFNQKFSKSIMLGIKDDWYYCYFPMPFRENMLITIVNEALAPINIETEIIYEPMDVFPADIGYFNAWWHRQNPTVNNELFPILDIKGRGHWCGVSHAMQGTGGLSFLEGDDMAWIDGRDNSFYNGTGTEDFFNAGFYFGSIGNAPYHGCGVYDPVHSRCQAFRTMIADCILFNKEAFIGIEHGPINNVEADYAGVTYWYAEASASHTFTPVSEDQRLPSPIVNPGNLLNAPNVLNLNRSTNASVITDKDMPFALDSGRAFESRSDKEPAKLTFNVTIGCTGHYSLQTRFLADPKGGLVQTYIDGTKVGEPFDTHSSKRCLVNKVINDLPWMKAGLHELSFRMLEKEPSEYYFAMDRLILAGAGRVIEFEDMNIASSFGTSPNVQDLAQYGSQWSNNAHLFFPSSKIGDNFTIEFNVEEAGTYSISAYLTKAPDYGIISGKLDGVMPCGQFDGYSPQVSRSDRIELSVIHLTAGIHTLTFETIGKNEASANYYSGYDCLILDKK